MVEGRRGEGRRAHRESSDKPDCEEHIAHARNGSGAVGDGVGDAGGCLADACGGRWGGQGRRARHASVRWEYSGGESRTVVARRKE